MSTSAFPTSCDIYLEIDGKKVAVVQSYSAKSTRSSRSIEAFGEPEPVATIPGPNRYTIELTRVYATGRAIADGIRFHDLTKFNLVICKPDRNIIYSDCQWSAISETGSLGETVLEKVTVNAAKRVESPV
ncbi:MAG: hypothetical protein IKD96_04055 [Oscillospiraceae bacterium]|nr:hypothetical protein [Oscillospiraceae bacterium]